MIVLFIQVKSDLIPTTSQAMPSVATFFPQIQKDLSRVKWGHGVNSREQLSQSIKGILHIYFYL